MLIGFDANNGIDSDTSSEISDESHFLTTDSETDYEEDKVKQIEKDKCHKCGNYPVHFVCIILPKHNCFTFIFQIIPKNYWKCKPKC